MDLGYITQKTEREKNKKNISMNMGKQGKFNSK